MIDLWALRSRMRDIDEIAPAWRRELNTAMLLLSTKNGFKLFADTAYQFHHFLRGLHLKRLSRYQFHLRFRQLGNL